MRLASLAAAVRHDRPDPSVTAGRDGTCHDAVRVGAMAETDPRRYLGYIFSSLLGRLV